MYGLAVMMSISTLTTSKNIDKILCVKKLPLDEECQDQIQWNGHFLFQGHCEQIQ